jgi:hypothetical protein
MCHARGFLDAVLFRPLAMIVTGLPVMSGTLPLEGMKAPDKAEGIKIRI